MSKPSVISLFTGAGGLDFGFEAAGFRTAVALEMDAKCCATLRHNRDWTVIQGDIANVSTAEILKAGKLKATEVDVLIGGPPCQPFSKSGFWATGEAKRLNDPRAATLDGYLRVLAEAKPRAFLLENVEGIGFKGKDEGLQLIQARLSLINEKEGTNYRANIAVVNAADYGVPQLRKRTIVIGSRDGDEFSFPASTHASRDELLAKGLRTYLTAWDALHDLPASIDPSVELKGKWANLLASIPEGQNYLWHTERGEGLPLFGWRTRFWSFMLKLAKTEPSWTIQAQPGPATGPFHWDNRRLTMREMARLQTFPDDFETVGTLTDAQRQLGNAVPSLLAEVLATEISVQLLGRTRPNRGYQLGVKAATSSPPPSVVTPVPAQYLDLLGDHEAHPGTGKGRGARQRTLVAAE
ncbi:Modification methylase HaeIII [Agrobacterium sp. DSM 25558]|uniref:DNA cytosine methyltransferase n=1 Tax=Agrobacterium sp. DSM 25558 TaxID=1907665 RepID=UPI0009725DF3|nr:DNA cytosine methyltransferase [Agrobacterium sp. DSM 25558]SCX26001.1 Modification methylase HaeIII [Agrobacterium sp. DSM 25558]